MAKLFIVGTPIGNLQDITLRALETLQKVSIIACEDTRVTRQLLNHYQISNKKLIAHHDQNKKRSAPGIIKLIQEGQDVALVSDAGMPVISDPGFELIRQCIETQVDLEVIPGVSAITTTLALANFDIYFKFLGFLKPKTIQRENQLKQLIPGTYIAFLSPHRILAELTSIADVWGSKTKVFLARELTKKFETHYRGSVKEVIEQIKTGIKGELTVAFVIPKKKGITRG